MLDILNYMQLYLTLFFIISLFNTLSLQPWRLRLDRVVMDLSPSSCIITMFPYMIQVLDSPGGGHESFYANKPFVSTEISLFKHLRMRIKILVEFQGHLCHCNTTDIDYSLYETVNILVIVSKMLDDRFASFH